MTNQYGTPNNQIWRSVGFWMAVVMGLLQAFYAVQALVDPSAFAIYRGTPLAAGADAAWVHTYASRTLFVALSIGYLLVRRDLATLRWIALIGLVMPVSDAVIAQNSGASISIIARHAGTVIYMIVTFMALGSWTRRSRPC
jgi:hypothetical protein